MKKHKQLPMNPVSRLVLGLRTNYANANANANVYANADAYADAYANVYANVYANADAYAYANADAGKFRPLLRHESFMIKINLICRMKWELRDY